MIYIPLIIIILIWTFNPYLKKIVLRDLNKYEYLFINTVCYCLITLLFGICLIKNKKIHLNNIKNLSFYNYSLILLTSFTSLLASLLLLYLITKKDVSYIIPHIQSVVIMLSSIIGYYFFYEQLNKYKCSGIFFIIMGLWLMNFK